MRSGCYSPSSTVARTTSSPSFAPNASTSTPRFVRLIAQLDPVNFASAARKSSQRERRGIPGLGREGLAPLTPLGAHPVGRHEARARAQQRAQPGGPVAQHALDLFPLVGAPSRGVALADEPGHAADDEVGGVGVGEGGELKEGPGGGEVVRV